MATTSGTKAQKTDVLQPKKSLKEPQISNKSNRGNQTKEQEKSQQQTGKPGVKNLQESKQKTSVQNKIVSKSLNVPNKNHNDLSKNSLTKSLPSKQLVQNVKEVQKGQSITQKQQTKKDDVVNKTVKIQNSGQTGKGVPGSINNQTKGQPIKKNQPQPDGQTKNATTGKTTKNAQTQKQTAATNQLNSSQQKVQKDAKKHEQLQGTKNSQQNFQNLQKGRGNLTNQNEIGKEAGNKANLQKGGNMQNASKVGNQQSNTLKGGNSQTTATKNSNQSSIATKSGQLQTVSSKNSNLQSNTIQKGVQKSGNQSQLVQNGQKTNQNVQSRLSNFAPNQNQQPQSRMSNATANNSRNPMSRLSNSTSNSALKSQSRMSNATANNNPQSRLGNNDRNMTRGPGDKKRKRKKQMERRAIPERPQIVEFPGGVTSVSLPELQLLLDELEEMKTDKGYGPLTDFLSKLLQKVQNLESGNYTRTEVELFLRQFQDYNEGFHYRMDQKPRGLALLLTNYEFYQVPGDPWSYDFRNRPGAEIDADKMEELLTDMGYIVTRRDNIKHWEMDWEMKCMAEMDHKKYDSFICIISSHGTVNQVYGCDGLRLILNNPIRRFRSEKCPSLNGKPKMFFLQSCQSEDTEEDRKEGAAQDAKAKPGELEKSRFLINDVDFLVGYSTLPGLLSYRHEQTGSWYLDALHSNLKQNYKKYDIVTILEDVNFDVGLKREQYNYLDSRQVPMFSSTLRGPVFFH